MSRSSDHDDPHSPRSLRKQELRANERRRDEIAERHDEILEKQDTESHDKAVEAFDFTHADVTKNPQLLREVLAERNRAIEEAARKRHVIDWGRTYHEIGEKVRQKAGLPTSTEQERQETLEEMKRSRGQE